MSGDITSANSIFVITVAGLLNAPLTLQNYAADRAWETAERELAETQGSVDGFLNAGWIYNPVDQTVSLSSASTSCTVFETVIAAQDLSKTIFRLGCTITLTSTGRKYTGVNGVLRSANQVPSAGRTLDTRTFAIRWQSMSPAGI